MGPEARGASDSITRAWATTSPPGVPEVPWSAPRWALMRRRGDRAAQLLEGDDAAQAVVGIDDHQGPARGQPPRAQKRLGGRVAAHADGVPGAGRLPPPPDLQRGVAGPPPAPDPPLPRP